MYVGNVGIAAEIGRVLPVLRRWWVVLTLLWIGKGLALTPGIRVIWLIARQRRSAIRVTAVSSYLVTGVTPLAMTGADLPDSGSLDLTSLALLLVGLLLAEFLLVAVSSAVRRFHGWLLSFIGRSSE